MTVQSIGRPLPLTIRSGDRLFTAIARAKRVIAP
jgi:hypothetical protein